MGRVESPLTEALNTLAEFDRSETYVYKTTHRGYDAIKTLASEGLRSQDQTTFLLSAQWLTRYVDSAEFKKPNIFKPGPFRDNEFTYASKVCAENLEALASQIRNTKNDSDTAHRQEVSIYLMNKLYETGDRDIKKAVLTAYLNLQPQIVRNMLTGRMWFDDATRLYLKAFPFNGGRVLKDVSRCAKRVPHSEFRPQIKNLFMDESTENVAEAMAKILLKKIGFTDDEIREQLADGFESYPEFVADNIGTIFALELRVKGISRWLIHSQGIKHFGRYPIELLTDQLKFVDDQNSPWGVVIFPDADHNGAFQENFLLFKRLKSNLDQIGAKKKVSFRLRIIEGESLFTLGKNLTRLYRQYGPLAFVIVGGHVSQKEIQFGTESSANELTKAQVESKPAIKRFIARVCIPGAPLIVSSCETGRVNGIAEALSKLNLEVFAPEKSTSLKTIKIEFKDKKLSIEPRYVSGATNEFHNGKRIRKVK